MRGARAVIHAVGHPFFLRSLERLNEKSLGPEEETGPRLEGARELGWTA
jgi:hypothetical protein